MDPAPASAPITAWLEEWHRGDDQARDRLLSFLQPHLRQIAARCLQHERTDHTLEANALVNELSLRLLEGNAVTCTNRGHFLALSAQIMRRILIDHARARVAGKRGGVQQRVTLSRVDGWQPALNGEEMLALDQALERLARADPRAARVVELRFFGGLAEPEVAEALGVSVITVKRDWKVARAWLLAQLASAR